MNVTDLKDRLGKVEEKIQKYGKSPEDVQVNIQINNRSDTISVFSDDIRVHYDNNGCASGCVIVGS